MFNLQNLKWDADNQKKNQFYNLMSCKKKFLFNIMLKTTNKNFNNQLYNMYKLIMNIL